MRRWNLFCFRSAIAITSFRWGIVYFFGGYRPLITEILAAARWCKSRCGLYLRINNVFKLDNFRVSILYQVLLESTEPVTCFTFLVKILKVKSRDTL